MVDGDYCEIMGKNIFGIEDAINFYQAKPTIDELENFSKIILMEYVLQKCKDTHVLVANFPLSVMDIKKIYPRLFDSPIGGWYKDEKFANIKGEFGWHLVPKRPRRVQLQTVQIMAYTMVGHYLRTKGEILFYNYGDKWFRCSDGDSDGGPVGVRVNAACGYEGRLGSPGFAVAWLGPTLCDDNK